MMCSSAVSLLLPASHHVNLSRLVPSDDRLPACRCVFPFVSCLLICSVCICVLSFMSVFVRSFYVVWVVCAPLFHPLCHNTGWVCFSWVFWARRQQALTLATYWRDRAAAKVRVECMNVVSCSDRISKLWHHTVHQISRCTDSILKTCVVCCLLQGSDQYSGICSSIARMHHWSMQLRWRHPRMPQIFFL